MAETKCTIGFLDFTGTFLRSKKRSFNPITVLAEKAREMGHVPRIYRVEKCQMFFDGDEAILLEKNKPLKPCDVLIPRVDLLMRLEVELAILEQFRFMGIPIINDYLPTLNAKNKLRTMQILNDRQIAVPKTVIVRKFEYLDRAIEEVGGYPVVLKSVFGSYGVGVVIVESARSLYSALDLILERMDSNIIMIQEFIADANGSDYRALVIGDRVVASMERRAKTGEFRSNLELGGDALPAKLNPEEQKIAIMSTRALGLQISGVDILRTKKGPVVMEVNANPGFKGLMETTRVDIPKAFIKFAVNFARVQPV